MAIVGRGGAPFFFGGGGGIPPPHPHPLKKTAIKVDFCPPPGFWKGGVGVGWGWGGGCYIRGNLLIKPPPRI
jgi:hypothetical protein